MSPQREGNLQKVSQVRSSRQVTLPKAANKIVSVLRVYPLKSLHCMTLSVRAKQLVIYLTEVDL